MVRTMIKPGAARIHLSIPVEYVGKELEVLVFPVNDALDLQVSDCDVKEQNSRRREAFQSFMRYKGTLLDNFDCEKELADCRSERYGHID